jgi:glycosyltransferase involved in cell wall biosynthesis
MTKKSIKDPISICFVMPKAYCLFNPEVEGVFGGSEVDLYYLSTELAKDANYNVSFIVADYGQPPLEQRENVTLIKSLNFTQNPLIGARKIWKALKKADAQIYMTKTPSPGVPLIAWFCRKHNRHFAYRTAHSDECDGTFLKKKYLLGKSFVWGLRQAKLVFAQTQSDADSLLKTTNVASTVIPNGHRMPGLSERTRDTILWVGRSVEFKNPHRFLELASQFPNEHFTFICQKATNDVGYDELIAQAGNIENLTHIPRAPFHEMDSYFLRAKVFVNTSRAEGFPNTFIQAGKAGVPILSLKVNPDSYLNRHQCGVCADGNWDNFLEGLSKLLNGDAWQCFGQNAHKYIAKKHDIAKIVGNYQDLLN